MATWEQELADRLNALAKSDPAMAAATGVRNIGNLSASDIREGQPIGGTTTYYSGYQPQSQYKPFDYEDYARRIKDIMREQEAARLAQLKAARQKTISGLQSSKGDITTQYQNALDSLNLQRQQSIPTFQGYRNQAAGAHATSGQRLKEIMAASGLAKGGENLTAQARLGGAYQGAMGDINLQQSQYNEGIDNAVQGLDREKLAQLQRIDEAIRAAEEAGTQEELALAGELSAMRNQMLLDAMYKSSDTAFALDNAYWSRYMDTLENAYRDKQYGLEERRLSLQEQQAEIDRQIQQIQLEMSRINLENLPEQIRLDMQEQLKRIQQIGARPYQSETDIRRAQIELEMAQEKLRQLKEGSNIRDNAIAMAQKDSDWSYLSYEEKQKRIADYEKLLSGNNYPNLPDKTYTDEELLNIL